MDSLTSQVLHLAVLLGHFLSSGAAATPFRGVMKSDR